jgi:hypothetical protein
MRLQSEACAGRWAVTRDFRAARSTHGPGQEQKWVGRWAGAARGWVLPLRLRRSNARYRPVAVLGMLGFDAADLPFNAPAEQAKIQAFMCPQ